MNATQYIEQRKSVIGWPKTEHQRQLIASLPYFKKYEAPHLPATMTFEEWTEAFDNYLERQV